jgi:hypothetical protein
VTSLDEGLVLLFSYFQRALRRTNKSGASVAALEASLKTTSAAMNKQVATLMADKTRLESDAKVAAIVLEETKRVASAREEVIEERGRLRDEALQVRVFPCLSAFICFYRRLTAS